MSQKPADELALTRQTTQEAVAERLRKLILSRQLSPGTRLVQDELAEQLGVSRTPIREALHKLAHEGLVTFSSYKGASVAKLSPSDLEELYTIRCALESHAAYLAAQRITPEKLGQLESLVHQMEKAFQQKDFSCLAEAHYQFHANLCAAAKQRRLCELIIQHLDMADLYQRMALSLGRGARDPIIEHREILAALQQRDADTASHLVRTHLQLTATELLGLFQKEQGDQATADS